MMVLVDTSVWVEIFRRKHPLDIESTVSMDDVVTCLPIIQEVLQGFVEEHAFRIAREAMWNLPVVENPMAATVYEEAAKLFRSARRMGLTIRSSIDCLIATCALRNDLLVLHRDRDFAALSKVSPLQARSLTTEC